MTSETMNTTACSDANLVAESLGGSRDAFRQIVERYQTLICSLAYNATGSVSQSEDLAQETFITAWKNLPSMREPEKLRGWLCGIVRNRIQRNLREEGREPVRNAAPLEQAHDSPAPQALPSEQAISREEEVILWRSLEKIPDLYREPLVLFYREHQSIEHVAVELDLSEDAVKQRLSRGRKLLQEEVQGFVESALQRTAPGQVFSNAVLAVLPMGAVPAAVSGVGAGAKSSAATKSGFLTAWLAPFAGILAGLVAQCLIIRATTPERRLRVKKTVQLIVSWVLLMGLAVGGENAVRWLGYHFEWSGRTRFVTKAGFWWFVCLTFQIWGMFVLGRILGIPRLIEADRGTLHPAVPPMKSGALAVVVAGVYLMLFSTLIRVAWLADDRLVAEILAGVMVALGIVAFLNIRGRTGLVLARACTGHLAVCSTVVLVALNLRIDVWVASAYGVTVSEAHRLQPVWIVPVLTLAFLICSGLIWVVAKPKRRL